MRSDVRWLDAEEQQAWRRFLDVQARLAAALDRELVASARLSLSDYDVLVHLTDTPQQRLRAYELGDRLQWGKSRVSKQVSRMAERGFVKREEAPEDRRGAYVTLTDAGRQAIEEAAPEHVELVRRLVFDELSRSQVRQLSTIADTVLRQLDELAAE